MKQRYVESAEPLAEDVDDPDSSGTAPIHGTDPNERTAFSAEMKRELDAAINVSDWAIDCYAYGELEDDEGHEDKGHKNEDQEDEDDWDRWDRKDEDREERFDHHSYVSARWIQANLLRDIFGNPFRPAAFSPSWRTSTVIALAAQMYESRDFGAMPILADALQDAGCDSADVLDHCRGEGPHVRGCWLVDLVLGKG
ncbi:hypothetical protein [Gemmata massiliana]|uniref:hypothetical protein n=1 Tax=Gemmata massiliana TaxID=1210884 RepID=UPI001E63F6C9|nr:hypothetical protein [Gemmata massiliana]